MRKLRGITADKKRFAAYVVIGAAILFRVVWSAWIAHAHPAAVTSGDTPDYLGPARALIEQHRFSLSPTDATPMFLRTPGYSSFLAAIWWVTGSQWALSPIQAAVTSVLTIALVMFVARRVSTASVALLAGVLIALDPLQFALSGTLLTEALDALLVTACAAVALLVFARDRRRVRPLHVGALGLALALTTMVRPALLFFPLIVLALLAWRFRRTRPRALLALLLAFVAPVVLVVGGWDVRNHHAVGSWEIAGDAGATLYCYNAAAVNARANGTSVKAARRQLGCNPSGWDDLTVACPSWWGCDVPHPLANGHGFDGMTHRGITILAHHPIETTEVWVAGLVREVLGPGTDTIGRFLNMRSSPLLTVLFFLWNAALWVFALAGAVAGLRSRMRAFWAFVVSMVLYSVVVSAGYESSARFRAPIVPLVALMAALGIVSTVRSLRTMPTGDVDRPDPVLEDERTPA